MIETDAADRRDADLFGTPEALRALAAKAKRFAQSVPHEVVGRQIIAHAARLEAEAAAMERLSLPSVDAGISRRRAVASVGVDAIERDVKQEQGPCDHRGHDRGRHEVGSPTHRVEG